MKRLLLILLLAACGRATVTTHREVNCREYEGTFFYIVECPKLPYYYWCASPIPLTDFRAQHWGMITNEPSLLSADHSTMSVPDSMLPAGVAWEGKPATP